MMATDWMETDDRVGVLGCRHFVSGAAAYRDGWIVASLLPQVANQRDYVLFTDSSIGTPEATRLIFGDEMQG
jgi:hypothetical protein